MPDSIIIALIGLTGSALGTFAGILTSSKLTQYRLQKLEEKVDAHNRLIERTYVLEGQMVEVQHDIRDLKARHADDGR